MAEYCTFCQELFKKQIFSLICNLILHKIKLPQNSLLIDFEYLLYGELITFLVNQNIRDK